MNISFEQLPEAVNQLLQKVDGIERLLLMQKAPSEEVDKLLTVEECAKFLNLSKQTIYGLTSKGELPMMKRGKRCYFSKLELIDYIKGGRNQTNTEMEEEVTSFLSKKGSSND